MAILKSQRGISLELKFINYSHRWIEYKFIIKYDNQSIRSKRISLPKDFFANDDEYDRLIPAFEKSMQSGQFTSWMPLEPDAWIEIQPIIKQGYKDTLVTNQQNLTSFPKDLITELKYIDKMHKKNILNPDDDFRIAFFSDTIYYGFPEANPDGSLGYTENGIGISFLTRRDELALFVNELKNEYLAFSEKYSVTNK